MKISEENEYFHEEKKKKLIHIMPKTERQKIVEKLMTEVRYSLNCIFMESQVISKVISKFPTFFQVDSVWPDSTFYVFKFCVGRRELIRLQDNNNAGIMIKMIRLTLKQYAPVPVARIQ